MTTLVGALVVMAVIVGVQFPALHGGFWSWDWYWLDQDARGNTAWGGPFYELSHHENPLPVEVLWYRSALALLGTHATAQHVLALGGLLITLAALYTYLRLIEVPRWAASAAVVLAGLAPSSLTSWTWFAASPHMWAATLGLGAAVAHLAWRRGGSRSWPLIIGAGLLVIAAVAMKTDGVLGVLLILAWEWTAPRSERRSSGRPAVTVMAVLPLAAFVWWQATAVDPHRDSARTGVGHFLSTLWGLLRFAFLTRTDAELRQEFPPGPAAPTILLVAGGVVGAAVLALAVSSLGSRQGQVLVLAGIGGLGPVAVLQPALVSRYVLPVVLALTGAAGVGAAIMVGRRWRRPGRRVARAVGTVAAVAAATVWGVLAHHSSGFGAVAVREESALLAGLQAAPFDVSGAVGVRLLGSPLDPSTAHLRMLDPALPLDLRTSRISVLAPEEAAPAGLRLVTAVRDDTGRYTVTSGDALP